MDREELVVYLNGGVLRAFENNTGSAGSMVAPHWHKAWEALFVRRGFGRQRTNSAEQMLYPGDTVLICPGDVHETEALSPDGMDIDVLQFSAEALAGEKIVQEVQISGTVRPTDSGMQRLFDAFRMCRNDDDRTAELMITGLLRILIALYLREGKRDGSGNNPVMDGICAYLETADDLSLAATAAHFGYCEEHLSRRFHREMGIAYRAYCTQIRMRRAAVQLRDGNDGLAAIAEQIGYSDENSLIRAFRRVYGLTPNAYRKRSLPVGRRPEKEKMAK